jgi:transketolase
VALVFTRQKLPILDTVLYPQIHLGVRSGGYILADVPGGDDPQIILIATGSEVHLAMQARERLLEDGVKTRVVSLPCWRLFQAQPQEYRDEVLPPEVPILAIEAGVSLGWRPYVGPHIEVIGVDKFGESAPGSRVMQEYGFNVENVVNRALKLLD